jgi:mRNA-degrading endonuclease RelE of RelBE toxin-antitoxin system
MSVGEPPEFEVRLRSKRVQRELDSLQQVDYQRVVAKLKSLSTDPRPRGNEKLHDNIHRVRVGDIRIVYLVDEGKRRIDVGAIRRRSEHTYKKIEDLFR